MFFTKNLKTFLIVGGLVTMFAGVYAINPEWALRFLNDMEYDSQYMVFFRHWGIMVGLMGFFLVGAAFKEEWRSTIILYSFLEKLFMVYLYVSNYFDPELVWLNERFVPFVITDISITLYTIGYWLELRKAKQ